MGPLDHLCLGVRWSAGLLLTLAALIGGCTSAATPAAPAPASPSKADAGEFTLTYEKTGGFLPFQDSLVIRGTGVIVYVDRTHTLRDAQVDPLELDRLRALVASREFQTAAPEYRNDRGADLVTHTIDVQNDASHKRVVVMDATNHPAVLDQIIAELERLAAETR
jgi:hypothetical protein